MYLDSRVAVDEGVRCQCKDDRRNSHASPPRRADAGLRDLTVGTACVYFGSLPTLNHGCKAPPLPLRDGVPNLSPGAGRTEQASIPRYSGNHFHAGSSPPYIAGVAGLPNQHVQFWCNVLCSGSGVVPALARHAHVVGHVPREIGSLKVLK